MDRLKHLLTHRERHRHLPPRLSCGRFLPGPLKHAISQQRLKLSPRVDLPELMADWGQALRLAPSHGSPSAHSTAILSAGASGEGVCISVACPCPRAPQSSWRPAAPSIHRATCPSGSFEDTSHWSHKEWSVLTVKARPQR
ncbi:unnamed protein product [Lota lota]